MTRACCDAGHAPARSPRAAGRLQARGSCGFRDRRSHDRSRLRRAGPDAELCYSASAERASLALPALIEGMVAGERTRGRQSSREYASHRRARASAVGFERDCRSWPRVDGGSGGRWRQSVPHAAVSAAVMAAAFLVSPPGGLPRIARAVGAIADMREGAFRTVAVVLRSGHRRMS